MPSLSKAASEASFWNLSSNALNGVTRFAVTAILARFLSPEIFGVFGMAVVVTGFISLFGNIGLGSALIYTNDPDESHFSTVFWANLFIGVFMALVTVCLSYPASLFFNSPDVFHVLIVLSLVFIVPVFTSIHSIKLQKELDYKKLGLGELVSNVISGLTAVILAYLGFGIWSLIANQVLYLAINSAWLWNSICWKPALVFNKDKFLRLFKYSRNILMESIFNYFSQNIDYLIIGKKLGAQGLGYYRLAYTVPHIPYERFTKKLSPILFPLLCKLTDNQSAYKKAYLSALKFNAMVIFPLMAVFISVADNFIPLVYGEKWNAIVPLSKVLALVCMVRCVSNFSGAVFNSKGRPDIGFKLNLIQLPFMLTALLFGVKFGVSGLVWAMFAVVFVFSIVVHVVLLGFVKTISLKDIIYALRPAVITSAIVSLILRFLSSKLIFNSSVAVLFGDLFFASLLIFLSYFYVFRRDFRELYEFTSSIKKKAGRYENSLYTR